MNLLARLKKIEVAIMAKRRNPVLLLMPDGTRVDTGQVPTVEERNAADVVIILPPKPKMETEPHAD
jgi:hypothetical protein